MKPLRRIAGTLALCCLLVVLCAAPVSAADAVKTATVSGVVTGEDGFGLAAQAVFSADGFLQRVDTDMLGRFALKLPLGAYELEITKGSEYERLTAALDVADRKAKYLGAFTLRKLYETDWLAGDLHQHSVYSFDGKNSPAEIVLSDLAAGLSFGVLSDHNERRGNLEYLSATLSGFLPIAGMEVTTDRGHINAIDFDADIDWSVAQGAADIERIVNEIHAQAGALAQINHPTRTEFPFLDWELAGKFDLFELWNGKRAAPYVRGEPNDLAVQAWFQMLNDGLFIAATAGSDNHDIDGNLLFASADAASIDDQYYLTSMYSGMPRTYVYTPERTVEGILAALKAGHSFLTNNPLAFFDIDGSIPGETAQAGECELHVKLQSNRGLLSYSVIVNGETALEEAVAGMEVKAAHTLTLQSGDWAVLEVLGEHGDYAISNPVFIE
jgi:hypothetical protein